MGFGKDGWFGLGVIGVIEIPVDLLVFSHLFPGGLEVLEIIPVSKVFLFRDLVLGIHLF